MPRVIHFDIAVDQPERAIKFYSEVFGWEIQKWEGPMDYWLVHTGDGPGIDGGLGMRTNPTQATTNTIGVPSVDEYMDKIEKSGGKIVMLKTPIPGVGWFASCQDTEGNIFGIIEEDASAR